MGEVGLGATVPPPLGEAASVSRYSVVKVAVNVLVEPEAGAVMPCDWAPPSLQLAKVPRVPPTVCGLATFTVWFDPGVQLKVCGAVSVTPSTMICSPAGTVVTVTFCEKVTTVLLSFVTTTPVRVEVVPVAVRLYVPAGSGIACKVATAIGDCTCGIDQSRLS